MIGPSLALPAVSVSGTGDVECFSDSFLDNTDNGETSKSEPSDPKVEDFRCKADWGRFRARFLIADTGLPRAVPLS